MEKCVDFYICSYTYKVFKIRNILNYILISRKVDNNGILPIWIIKYLACLGDVGATALD